MWNFLIRHDFNLHISRVKFGDAGLITHSSSSLRRLIDTHSWNFKLITLADSSHRRERRERWNHGKPSDSTVVVLIINFPVIFFHSLSLSVSSCLTCQTIFPTLVQCWNISEMRIRILQLGIFHLSFFLRAIHPRRGEMRRQSGEESEWNSENCNLTTLQFQQ